MCIITKSNERELKIINMEQMVDNPTQKQLECIESIMEHGEYSPPNFTGKTKQEASAYISKYKHCLVNKFSIENGY